MRSSAGASLVAHTTTLRARARCGECVFEKLVAARGRARRSGRPRSRRPPHALAMRASKRGLAGAGRREHARCAGLRPPCTSASMARTPVGNTRVMRGRVERRRGASRASGQGSPLERRSAVERTTDAVDHAAEQRLAHRIPRAARPSSATTSSAPDAAQLAERHQRHAARRRRRSPRRRAAAPSRLRDAHPVAASCARHVRAERRALCARTRPRLR